MDRARAPLFPDHELADTRAISLAVIVPALAAAYFITAWVGLSMAITSAQVTVVWPPMGLAIAAVLIFGLRVWPGIFAGALAINSMAGDSIPAAFGIAAGNTLGRSHATDANQKSGDSLARTAAGSRRRGNS